MSSSFAITFAQVLLQYGILFFLFYFLWKMGKSLSPALIINKQEDRAAGNEPDEAVLTILDGPDAYKGRRFAFRESLTVGRAEDNDLVISDNFVSHHHIVFRRVQTLYTVQDLGSSNHTYVNEEVLSDRRILRNGDHIRIGMITILFER